MQYKIIDLIKIREEELMNNNYSLDFCLYCKKIWKMYLKYSIEHNDEYINATIENDFLNDFFDMKLENYNDAKQRHPVNVINLLNDFESFNTKTINYKSRSKFEVKNEYYIEELTKYLKYLKDIKNNSVRTLSSKKKGTIIFINYLEENNILSFKDITKEIINNYCENFNKEILSKKIFLSFTLKSLLHYLYDEEIIKTDYCFFVPVIKRNCKHINKAFEKDDVEAIINYMNDKKEKSTNGYRNYAIILIAAKTGIRKIDIINLKYSAFNWTNNTINIVQIKTQKSLTVPFTNDIGNAIIDYINKERPFKLKDNDDYIFIRNSYPMQKLSNSYSMFPYICKALNECGIDKNKYTKKGLHCFRFSLATEMLKNETPLNIISSSLGHSTQSATKTYISTSVEKLKDCFVEVPNEL